MPLEELEDGSEKRIIRPKHDRWADQNGIGKGLPNRQLALTTLSDIKRLREGSAPIPET